MPIFDSHVHLDDPRFDADREAVMQRARGAGVDAMIVPGVTAATWGRTLQLAASADNIWAGLGLHPYFLREHRHEHLAALEQQLSAPGVIAVGECGLDFFLDDLDREAQQFYFDGQLALASSKSLPVIVHARKALDAVISALRRYPGVRAQIHSFSGSLQQAHQLLDLGCVLSIGTTVSFERAKRLREIVRSLPLDAFTVETDAPDQPGAGHRGERNEPAFIPEVINTMAALRDEDAATIAEVTDRTTRQFFRLEETHVR